jgi:hypothetical protein
MLWEFPQIVPISFTLSSSLLIGCVQSRLLPLLIAKSYNVVHELELAHALMYFGGIAETIIEL